MGVHPQKQPGLFFVGACVPAGRLQAQVRKMIQGGKRRGRDKGEGEGLL